MVFKETLFIVNYVTKLNF